MSKCTQVIITLKIQKKFENFVLKRKKNYSDKIYILLNLLTPMHENSSKRSVYAFLILHLKKMILIIKLFKS